MKQMLLLENRASGPVRATASSHAAFLPPTAAAITGGFWRERRRMNEHLTIPSTWSRLHAAGNYLNMEAVAGIDGTDPVDSVWFFDTDIYKWLEAVGWTLQHDDLDPTLRTQLEGYVDETVTLLARAQASDGYLQSYYQLKYPGARFQDLEWGHELYNAGHLIQAGIAVARGSGDLRLLEIGIGFADLIVRSFGTDDGQIDGICGHPEIEMALIELFRETGTAAYLEKANYFIDRRGHGLLGKDQFGPQYWQDRVPLRDATAVEGHAVRQLYLLSAAADAFVETNDDSLRQAAERLWQEMVSTRTYITGGLGTHHRDEAFGDPYELTNDRSYCETCAAIASIMFSWRMLLITGEAKYAELIERTLYNGFLAGLAADGVRYVYANPLQIREGHVHQGNQHDYQRQEWFSSACCPPNVMRTLASLEHYTVISNDTSVLLHQYMSGTFTSSLAAGAVTLNVETMYPNDGRVSITITETPATEWELVLRVPGWSEEHSVSVNSEQVDTAVREGWLRVKRRWVQGDVVEFDLALTPRLTAADPRVDADRGALAVECGPIVYCVEQVDNPGVPLDDIVLDAAVLPELGRGAVDFPAVDTVEIEAVIRDRPTTSWWPYATHAAEEPGEVAAVLTAVPYYLWGNRDQGAMRVWLRTR